ncbi:uncharacterized protein LOC125955482 [Anopheles darlingi]|uniref:uncharacterized protein LOC125955482 n=1 Tax=Anopheles darlingi TaxID=43151 RepID=UPI0021004D11|nr:uncharacterized protein LOC125955482 [Anopheles darlingi]
MSGRFTHCLILIWFFHSDRSISGMVLNWIEGRLLCNCEAIKLLYDEIPGGPSGISATPVARAPSPTDEAGTTEWMEHHWQRALDLATELEILDLQSGVGSSVQSNSGRSNASSPRGSVSSDTDFPVTIQSHVLGDYWHFGLENALKRMEAALVGVTHIELRCHFDGVPVENRHGTWYMAWPFSFEVVGLEEVGMQTVSLFGTLGDQKPPVSFIEEFAIDANEIEGTGVMLHGIRVQGQYMLKGTMHVLDASAVAPTTKITTAYNILELFRIYTATMPTFVRECIILPMDTRTQRPLIRL